MKYKLILLMLFLFDLVGYLQNEMKITIVSSLRYSEKNDNQKGVLSIKNNKYVYYYGEEKADSLVLYTLEKSDKKLLLDGHEVDFIGSKEYVIDEETYNVEKYQYIEPDVSDSMLIYYFVEKVGLILIHGEMRNVFFYSYYSNRIIMIITFRLLCDF
ncbi:MAG: hypothetical protein N4A72_23025 [Bacteroidales bacterium]|jgi:hypothetical protein|nr:hypothetical protein [Bacteroidales bacterium]